MKNNDLTDINLKITGNTEELIAQTLMAKLDLERKEKISGSVCTGKHLRYF